MPQPVWGIPRSAGLAPKPETSHGGPGILGAMRKMLLRVTVSLPGKRLEARPSRTALAGLLFLSLLQPGLFPANGWAQVSVLTGQYDNARTTANTAEKILTVENVQVGRFGKLFSRQVDGYLYAQPLYVSGVEIPGQGARNVVYVATTHNTVYAFDADDARASEPLWQTNLGPAVPHASSEVLTVNTQPNCLAGGSDPVEAPVTGGSTLIPEIGILSTPVIDATRGSLYVVAATLENRDYCHKLYVLDIATGKQERAAVPIEGSVPGNDLFSNDRTVTFASCRLLPSRNWVEHIQRAALLLSNGVIYVGFAVFHDPWAVPAPWHGWVMAYDAETLAPRGVFNTTPQGGGGGIWHSGRGMAADSEGTLYAMTGNGDFDGSLNLSQSFLRLGGDLQVTQRFTPSNWKVLNDHDLDFNTSGPLLVPGSELVIAGSKEGFLYLLNRQTLAVADSFPLRPCELPLAWDSCYQIHHYAYWNGPQGPTLFVWNKRDDLKALFIDVANGRLGRTPMSRSGITPEFPGGVVAVSADGSQAGTGIVWATTPTADAEATTVPGVLRAFDASDVSKELWNSEQNASRDSLGNFAKFNVPTIANGKVYVATFSNRLVVYGLAAGDSGRRVHPRARAPLE